MDLSCSLLAIPLIALIAWGAYSHLHAKEMEQKAKEETHKADLMRGECRDLYTLLNVDITTIDMPTPHHNLARWPLTGYDATDERES